MPTSLRSTFLHLDPLTPGTCEWCGKDCDPVDAFCCVSCEAQNRRLESAQGLLVIRALKQWRRHRGRKGTPGEGQITEVAALVDRFTKADRRRREKMAEQRRLDETTTKEKGAQDAA